MTSTLPAPTAGTAWPELAERLTLALHHLAAPVAITFLDAPPSDIPAFDAPMPEPTPDGRTGPVAAGCVFWMHAPDRTFSTVSADHANCSVGSYAHNLLSLEGAATRADVGALVESGSVSPEAFPAIPAVTTRPASIVYGPLAETPVDPNVVLLRLNAQAMMGVTDALPDLHVEGKPQCHIVAVSHEHGRVAASVRCALSRGAHRHGHPHSDLRHPCRADRGGHRASGACRRHRWGGGPLRTSGRPALPVGGGSMDALLAVPAGSERDG